MDFDLAPTQSDLRMTGAFCLNLSHSLESAVAFPRVRTAVTTLLLLFAMSRLASVAVRVVKLSAGYVNATGIASGF